MKQFFALLAILVLAVSCGNNTEKKDSAATNEAEPQATEQTVMNPNDPFAVKLLSDITRENGVREIRVETCKEVCSKQIVVSIKDGIIVDAEIVGGCPGNTLGVTKLVKGMKVEEAIDKLEGIPCADKTTSCPDQLTKALRFAL